MSTLEIHDGFEPYYAGRKPFKQDQKPLPKARERAGQKGTASHQSDISPNADTKKKTN